MTENREPKRRAQRWHDHPDELVSDLTAVLNWAERNLSTAADQQTEILVSQQTDTYTAQLIQSVSEALVPYCRVRPHHNLRADLVEDLLELTDDPSEEAVSRRNTVTGELRQILSQLKPWAERRHRHEESGGERSELLRATIEQEGDELIIRTDRDGSLKLRGSTNIPMFLAFWNAPKHRLTEKAFLDIDRSVRPTNLQRHKNRLSAKLQDVLLEIITEKDNSFVMKTTSSGR